MEELKNKMRYLVLAIITTACLKLAAQDSTTYNLNQCIDIALKNNLSTSIAEQQKKSSKALLQQSYASFLPSISAYANQGISTGKSINPYTNTFINQEVNTGQYGVNANMNLFSGLSSLNNNLQSNYNFKASKLDFEQTLIDIKSQVTNAYLQILKNQELVNQAEAQIKATQEQLERLNTLNLNQAISPSILYDTKGQLGNDKINLINSNAYLFNSILSLSQLLNVNMSTSTKFEKINTDIKISENNIVLDFNSIKNTIPAIQSSSYKTKSALGNLNSARGQLFPTLSLNGSLGSNYSSAALSQQLMSINNVATDAYVNIAGTPTTVYAPEYNYSSDRISFNTQFKNNLNTYVGLSLQLTIFNGLRTKTQINLAKANYERTQVQQKTTETLYKTIIEQLQNDLTSAFERYNVIKEQEENYNQSFLIAKTKFEKGSLTSFEFISTKSNHEKAISNLISAKYDYLLKEKILDLYLKRKSN